MRPTVSSCATPLLLYIIFPHYFINGTIFGKLFWTKHLFRFSLQTASETLLILRKTHHHHHHHNVLEGLGVFSVPWPSRWSWSLLLFLGLPMFLRPFGKIQRDIIIHALRPSYKVPAIHITFDFFDGFSKYTHLISWKSVQDTIHYQSRGNRI
jgi:hypothetical protein